MVTGPVVLSRPVMLVRYRRDVLGLTTSIVHAVPLPADTQTGLIGALCGAILRLAGIETVTPGEGMPCPVCVHRHTTGDTAAPTPASSGPDTTGCDASGIAYQEWGWPVTRHRDQVRLSLDRNLSALMIPTPLCAQVLAILTQRGCTPPVLAHPYAPAHHVVLTGEKSELRPPWPDQVHPITGILLLPPSLTPRGPILWITTPDPNSLQGCREIDLFTALCDTAPDTTSPGGDPP